MKKSIIVIMLIMFCLVSGSLALAVSTEVDANKGSEKEISELFDMALNGVSDVPISVLKDNWVSPKIEILDEQGQKTVSEVELMTAQVIDQVFLSDGSAKETVELTAFVVLSEDMKPVDASILGTAGSKEEEVYDGSYNVKAYLKIYFDQIRNGSTYYLCLTRVQGNWQILDSSCSLSNRTVIYGYCGDDQNGVLKYKRVPQSPPTNSYNYNTGFTDYVANDHSLVTFGGSSMVTITRGGSNWTLDLAVVMPAR